MRPGYRAWTDAEEDYLQEKWGTVSVPAIARHLGRSVNAVKVRAQRLGCGPVLMGGDYITLNQLLFAVKGTNAGVNYSMKSWVQNRGLPVHTKKVIDNSFRVVYLHEFWAWAEKNRSFIDFSKMEPLALGEEPLWVADQRKKDFQAFALQRKDPWTSEEDSRLKMLLRQHKYGYKELSEMLRRSAGAIQRRINDLGLKERPVKADNHSEDAKWTDSDFEILADGIRLGESYTAIGLKLDKSEKAIRGKVYFVYLTESADKVRAMMGDGPWGTGAPVPTVKQAVVLSRTRTATKLQLSQLCGVLEYRLRQMKATDYDRYFQRAMCANWDDLHSECKAGCEDCDSCSEFVRIRPQYCVRCGATFFERAEGRLCQPCRAARKRQAYKKYRHLYGGVRGEKHEDR
ncbi:MAG: hypothetical protein II290_02760 [Oscillospiraceae bacterium]|nr:hypothetical protein [Oscillospiraceae bacterium]